MSSEVWTEWIILDAEHDPYQLAELVYKSGDLTIQLRDRHSRKKIEVKFTAPLAFRIADEGDMLVALQNLQKGIRTYQVLNSKYISWFLNQNCNIRADDNLQHFVLCTQDDIIEVLDLDAPEVKIF